MWCFYTTVECVSLQILEILRSHPVNDHFLFFFEGLSLVSEPEAIRLCHSTKKVLSSQRFPSTLIVSGYPIFVYQLIKFSFFRALFFWDIFPLSKLGYKSWATGFILFYFILFFCIFIFGSFPSTMISHPSTNTSSGCIRAPLRI